MGIEQPSRLATVLRVDVPGARPATRAGSAGHREDEVVPSPQWAAKAWRYWWLTSSAKGRRIGFVADAGLAAGTAWRKVRPGLDLGHLGQPRGLIASPRIADSSNVLSLASAPSFQVGEVAAEAPSSRPRPSAVRGS